jgi:hypothetical protein
MPDDRRDESRLEEGLHDTEIKEETHIRGSMGVPPTDDEPKVTPESDVFEDQKKDERGA